jgi:hypothetical protein
MTPSELAEELGRYATLLRAAEKARDALDDIQDEANDIAKPLTLKQAREVARKAFYPLAEAIDAIARRSTC